MTQLDPSTVAFLAGQFADVVHDWTTPEQFAEIKTRNAAETNPSICHSHDFIDANEAMDQSFRQSLGRAFDMNSDADIALWNAAWEQAIKGWLR